MASSDNDKNSSDLKDLNELEMHIADVDISIDDLTRAVVKHLEAIQLNFQNYTELSYMLNQDN